MGGSTQPGRDAIYAKAYFVRHLYAVRGPCSVREEHQHSGSRVRLVVETPAVFDGLEGSAS